MMDAEIIEFKPEVVYKVQKQLVCSFCGVTKEDSVGKFLVEGLEGNLCASCIRSMKELINK